MGISFKAYMGMGISFKVNIIVTEEKLRKNKNVRIYILTFQKKFRNYFFALCTPYLVIFVNLK